MSKYYRLINPYLYHSGTHFYYHYVFPENNQPTGSLNFSRVRPTLKSVAKRVMNALSLIRCVKTQRMVKLESVFVNDSSLPVEVWFHIIKFSLGS